MTGDQNTKSYNHRHFITYQNTVWAIISIAAVSLMALSIYLLANPYSEEDRKLLCCDGGDNVDNSTIPYLCESARKSSSYDMYPPLLSIVTCIRVSILVISAPLVVIQALRTVKLLHENRRAYIYTAYLLLCICVSVWGTIFVAIELGNGYNCPTLVDTSSVEMFRKRFLFEFICWVIITSTNSIIGVVILIICLDEWIKSMVRECTNDNETTDV
jgi:hypothetical protein